MNGGLPMVSSAVHSVYFVCNVRRVRLKTLVFDRPKARSTVIYNSTYIRLFPVSLIKMISVQCLHDLTVRTPNEKIEEKVCLGNNTVMFEFEGSEIGLYPHSITCFSIATSKNK